MKKSTNFWLFFIFISTLAFVSCDEDNIDNTPIVTELKTVTTNITTNTTWKASSKYLLVGFIYVKPGVILTIEPGTIIKGDKATKATLIIEPGARLIAEGTAAKPIVFTSNQVKGSRNYGDWGGVILLGNATVNKPDPTIEGENISKFGGTNDSDNSGILKYVRIEFAGIAFETDKEINGLTLGGVGSGTTIDYVQVSFSGDDGYEWFGGNVNAKHLISYKNLDDDFDTDWGFTGNVQFGFVLRDPTVADQCDCSDSNCFESDNDGTGSDATPKTAPKFSNITMVMGAGTVNGKHARAFRIRRNSALSVYNSIAVGEWKKGGFTLQGDNTNANLIAGTSVYKGIQLAGMSTPWIVGSSDLSDASATILQDATYKNKTYTYLDELKLAVGYNDINAKPGLLPVSGSALLNAGIQLPSGFTQDATVGAFNTQDWTGSWANWDPQNTEY